jgi:hypothetical protein
VLVFVRIPKTGSQTLDRIARQNYSRDRVRGLPNMFTDPERCRKRLQQVMREGTIDLLSGHIAYDPRVAMAADSRFFSMVREPVKRAISHYHAYIRRQVQQKGVDPKKFTIERVIDERPLYVPDNMQTRVFSGHSDLEDPPYGQCSREMLEVAKRNIELHFDIVGLTERFGESVVLLSEIYGWSNLVYSPVNVWATPDASALSPDTVRTIRGENRLDLELYDFVRARFEDALMSSDKSVQVRAEALYRVSGSPSHPMERVDEALVETYRELFRIEHELAGELELIEERVTRLEAIVHRLELASAKRNPRARK